MTILNALTVDVEDYFQVSAFERYVDRSRWDHFPLRVVNNTERVLDLLDEFGIKGTFFVLGWVAQRCPGLVREIRKRGHEIASHGYDHQLVYRIGPAAFREDLRRSKLVLEDAGGETVCGYRAPSYSITKNSLWALEILAEEGFTFDSSIFPVYHDIYGMPKAPRFPFLVQCQAGAITEFPLTTYPLSLAGRRYLLPVAGGGYLRLLPAELLGRCFSAVNRLEGQPTVLYFHPWEIDPDQPHIRAGLKSRFRHYLNLSKTEGKLRQIFAHRTFCTMSQVLLQDSLREAMPGWLAGALT